MTEIKRIKDFNLLTFKGIAAQKSNDGRSFLIPSGAVFPQGIKNEKMHKVELLNSNHTDKQLKIRDILFNTGGEGTLGRTNYFTLNDGNYYADSFVLTIRNKDERLDSQFLFYTLNDFNVKKQIENLKVGTTGITAIKESSILEIEFYFPSDLNVQTKIASIFSILDKAIASTQQLITKYQHIKTGLLHDFLTCGIDEKGNLRNKKTHQFKDSKLGRIPVEWECKPLGEIYIDLKSGSTPLRSRKAYFENGTFLWVKTLDLNEDDIYTTQELITSTAIEESSCNLFPINSVLIAMYGGWEQIGRTALLKKEATTNQAITALFNPRVSIIAEYTQFFLQYYRYKWKSFAVSTRKDPNITKTDIQNYLIAFPKDDKEQIEIVKALKNSKRTISNYIKQLNKLQSLKTGLMQDLLSGKVRVKI